jgi:hypothetical protein
LAEAKDKESHLVSVDQTGAIAGGHMAAGDLTVFEHPSIHIYNQDPQLADEKIRELLRRLRSNRFLTEFDRLGETRKLAASCTSGPLASGSNAERSVALAWCARLLSSEDIAEAEGILAHAKALAETPATQIAEAFIISKRAGKANALAALAKLQGPAARSAALFVVIQNDGKQEALAWLARAGIRPEDLDADGKVLVLENQLQQGDLEIAVETADTCSEQDCDECPLLRLNLAFSYLLRIVPKDFRQLVQAQVPFEMAVLEFASGEQALAWQRQAQQLFRRAAEHFIQLGLPKAAEVAEGYDLWLMLRHPEMREQGRERLSTLLCDLSQSLRYIPFAVSFGVKLDHQEVEKEIDRQVALNGGPTADVSIARLSLAGAQSTPAEVARYITRHRNELETHIDSRALAFLEIEMLARSNQTELARDVFDSLAAEIEITEADRQRLELVLVVDSVDDPIAECLKLYEATESVNDLRHLVDLLEEKEDWERAADFSLRLYSKTESLPSAEQLVNACLQAGRVDEALDFLDTHAELLPYSPKLKVLRGWTLYNLGRVLEAKASLPDIVRSTDPRNYRALRHNIAVATGDWNQLSQIVAADAEDKKRLSPQQLLQSSFHGFQIGAPAAKSLLAEAARSGHDDANIMAAAYFLAINFGLDEDAEITAWLHRAAELSGDEGPIYTASLEEIMERQPAWSRREQNTRVALHKAEVPMFVAAQSLNSSLIEMMLMPLLSNQQEVDPRKRIAVPAFSGKRGAQVGPLPQILGVDASAILTLGGLGLLEKLIKTGRKILISHSTFEWLFMERKRAAFHQPSRFIQAQHVQNLLANGGLYKFTANQTPDHALVVQVGHNLASMIAQAKNDVREEPSQLSYVVRSSPVPLVGSFMKEDVDLTAHSGVLVSCLGIVEKLVSLGRMTAPEARRARSYLLLNEKSWPFEPEIKSGSALYLDGLSVTYLQSCGVLDRLNQSGFKAYVDASIVEEAKALLTYQRMSGTVDRVIEDIRSTLEAAIASGQIELGRSWRKGDGDGEDELRGHPTFGMLSLAARCDAIIADDRYINQHEFMNGSDETTCRILSSIDVIKMLRTERVINAECYHEAIFRLRRGGYLFIDVEPDELLDELMKCPVVNGELQETAEVRSIREAFLFSNLSRLLNIETETAWLDRAIQIFTIVYRSLWESTQTFSDTATKALWLFSLFDIRLWLHCFSYKHAQYIMHVGRGRILPALVVAPSSLDDDRKAEFLAWVDEYIVTPLTLEYPELYDQLVESHKQFFKTFLDSLEQEKKQVD